MEGCALSITDVAESPHAVSSAASCPALSSGIPQHLCPHHYHPAVLNSLLPSLRLVNSEGLGGTDSSQ